MNTGGEFSEIQKAEIKLIVHEALTEFFTKTGGTAKNILIGTAAVIGAIIVIGGGIKVLLAAIGFSYVGK